MKQNKKVAVLLGGWSAEREISLSSGQGMVAAVKELGYTIIPIDVTRDTNALWQALQQPIDVILNALHGTGGEDGVIQGMLEILRIPYTHSGVTASALGMHKVLAKKVFLSEGILTPPYKVIPRQDLKAGHPMLPPYVIKPINDGSSKGVMIVHKDEGYVDLGPDWIYGDHLLIEQYIPGRDIHVAVMGDRALGAIEVQPLTGFSDYEAKYTPGKAKHFMPAPLSSNAYEQVLALSLKAHKALECRGVSRLDFRYDDTKGEANAPFYLLEINTQPGMTPNSLVPEIAAHAGITYPELVEWMINNAQCDT